jgi:hypothetical protein
MINAVTRVVNPEAIVLAVTLEMPLGEWQALARKVGTDGTAALAFAHAVGDAIGLYTQQASAEVVVAADASGVVDVSVTPGQKAP